MAGDLVIVAGFGFRSNASVESLLDALAQASGAQAVSALATARDKAMTDVFRAAAEKTGLPISAVAPDALVAQETVTRSAQSQKAHGTGSVAEAAALAAAGPGACLIVPRVISNDRLATCALAEGLST